MDVEAPQRSPTAAAPWLGALADAADDAPAAGEFRHAFRIGTRWFLIPAGMPGEVYPPLPCARLPFTHAWCLGLASFRGDLAPVYDLGALFEGHTAGPGRYLLLLGRRDACAALCIDAVTGITVAADTPAGPDRPWPEPSLPEPWSGLARGALAHDGTDYHALDLPGLLGLLADQASLLQRGTTPS